jgi:hypothetical protein
LDDPVQHIGDFRVLQLVEVLFLFRLVGRQIIVAVEDEALAELLCRWMLSKPEQGGRRYMIDFNQRKAADVTARLEIPPMPPRHPPSAWRYPGDGLIRPVATKPVRLPNGMAWSTQTERSHASVPCFTTSSTKLPPRDAMTTTISLLCWSAMTSLFLTRLQRPDLQSTDMPGCVNSSYEKLRDKSANSSFGLLQIARTVQANNRRRDFLADPGRD